MPYFRKEEGELKNTLQGYLLTCLKLMISLLKNLRIQSKPIEKNQMLIFI